MSDTPMFDKFESRDSENQLQRKVIEQITIANYSGAADTLAELDPVEPSAQPQPKVLAATAGSAVGGAAALLLAWILGMFGVMVPGEVQGAVSILLVAAGTFVAGYWKRN